MNDQASRRIDDIHNENSFLAVPRQGFLEKIYYECRNSGKPDTAMGLDSQNFNACGAC